MPEIIEQVMINLIDAMYIKQVSLFMLMEKPVSLVINGKLKYIILLFIKHNAI
jgi:hypothetical protein